MLCFARIFAIKIVFIMIPGVQPKGFSDYYDVLMISPVDVVNFIVNYRLAKF
jgi:hypothetical protein